jgi:hypothetical protein
MRASESWHNFWICSRKKKDDSDKSAYQVSKQNSRSAKGTSGLSPTADATTEVTETSFRPKRENRASRYSINSARAPSFGGDDEAQEPDIRRIR